ncbi:MAG: glycosyltransferase family 39 protein [Acidobacteria bacterium]|nr:glycosyltransferase family 39 protein [Acidobacteriota bacterium]
MKNQRIVIIALAVIFLLAALLRLHALTRKSLWDDEIFSLNALGIYKLHQEVPPWLSFPQNLVRYYRADNHPPFFFLLLGVWLKLFGQGALAMRALSVILNLLTLPVIYLLALQIFKERKIAILSCLIFGFSAYLVYYSQEARMYPLLLLLSCLSMLFFLKIQEGADWRCCLGFIVFSVLGLYTHYYYAFLICFQVLYWIIFENRRIYAFFLSIGIVFLAFIPWLPILLYQINQKNHSDLWIRSNSGGVQWQEAVFHWVNILFRFAVGENFIYPGSASQVRQIMGVVAVIAVVVLLQRPFLLLTRYGKLLALWLLLPLTGGFIADVLFQTKTLEMSKYFIMSYPAMLMMLAASILRFPWRPAKVILLLALVLLNASALRVYYRIPHAVEWREVAAYLSARVGERDTVLSTEPRVETCVVFYLGKEIKTIPVPYDAQVQFVLGAAQKSIASSERLWVVSIYESVTPELREFSERLELEFPLLSKEVISGNVIVRSFAGHFQARS